MHSFYEFFFLVLAASALLSCEQKRDNVPENSSRLVKENASFVRDTSAYVMVVDTAVHDSAINGELIPVNQGGFTEYFKGYSQEGTNAKKMFYAYSDSTSPFIKGTSSMEMAFINLVASAYADHNSIEINPDDIWLTILDGIRLHVKSNRDSLKDRFVSPGADTAIAIVNNSLSWDTTYEKWHGVIADLFDSLQMKMPVEIGEPLNIKFSTTNPIDYNVSRSMVMAVASEYYTYTLIESCGIPKIKVNGTKLDWSLLKDSFNKLASRLDLEWWAKELNPVLDEFINIFDGKINLSHWKNIYKFVESEDCGTDPVNGWITKFYPYIGRDNLERRTDWNEGVDYYDVPMGLTDVDVNWIYYGKKIPLKIYTGFVGIQVDTTRNMLKASRGYALMSYCGWCDLKNIAKTLTYISGKPLRLQESLAIADSMDAFGAQGLAYATSDLNEIERFAEAAVFKEENRWLEYDVKEKIENANPKYVINLYKNGKMIERLTVYKQLGQRTVRLLRDTGKLIDSLSIENFFKKRNVFFEGEFNEYPNDIDVSKLHVEIYVDTFERKDGLVVPGYVRDTKQAINWDIEKFCGWRLKNAFYRHFKKDFNLSVDAKLIYGENGQVANVVMETKHPKYKAFLEEIKEALYYGWDAPKKDANGDKGHIMKSVKLHLSFTRDYRMVCKKNGQAANDSVYVFGAPNTKNALCNEITFTKDLATGDVNHYRCKNFDVKAKLRKQVPLQAQVYFNKTYYKYSSLRDFPFSRIVTLKIPPCFVEE